ncbi:MAG: prepilin-type N-terminal cleavage/methylation domain-containing protein [Planctomycetes bacterium]|nr:prepilin-type N-terminal cleavage/methylation domain-containing protein [Planctomycetota bacterium]
MMGYQNIMRRRHIPRVPGGRSRNTLSPPPPEKRATPRTARSAFSLAELMIAIVILGLGLLMVAGMFPVGWLKARELAEFTTSQSCVAVAEVTVKHLCQVEGPYDPDSNAVPSYVHPDTLSDGAGSSFIGDFLASPNLSATSHFVRDPFLAAPPNTNVHVLNVENLLAATGTTVPEDLWRLEIPDPLIGVYDFGADPAFAGPIATPWLGRFPPLRMWYGLTQVTVGDRVYPPMPTGVIVGTQAWNDALVTRKFAWSVLYRLPVLLVPTLPGVPYSINEVLASTRQFTAYYVTLRRTQPTHRFAQQDHPGVNDNGGLINFVTPPSSVIVPQVAASDLMFPVAWLVPLDLIVSGAGIPATAEVMANAGPDHISPMLPPGSQFVVSGTGSVYRVEQREILGTGSVPLTRLTLDRPLELVDQASITHFVWVYPPHVERDEGPISFFGPSPVVAIDVRTLTMSP